MKQISAIADPVCNTIMQQMEWEVKQTSQNLNMSKTGIRIMGSQKKINRIKTFRGWGGNGY